MSTTDQLPEPELGYIKTDKSNQPAFSACQMQEAMQDRAQVHGEPMAWLHWLHGPVRVFMNKDEAMMELDRLNREYPVDSGDRKMRPLILGDTTPQPAQATQAEVTDEELLDAYNSIDPCNESPQDRLIRRLRAILALRPERVPMTDDDVDAKCLAIIGHLLSRRERDRIVWRMAEAHHGITAHTRKEDE